MILGKGAPAAEMAATNVVSSVTRSHTPGLPARLNLGVLDWRPAKVDDQYWPEADRQL